MNNNETDEKQKDNLKISIDIINKDSDDSMNDNDFQTAKYISLAGNLLSVEKIKSNNHNNHDYNKKNTKMSSGVEDIEDTVNENDNNNSINVHIQNTNNKNIFNLDENNNISCDNLIIAHHNKKKYLYESHLNINDNQTNNNNDKVNNSENGMFIKKAETNFYKSSSPNKLSSFSPNKKRRKLVLEEKTKNRGRNRSVYATEHKEEKKEDEKKHRKDKNGTEICKKNKKKVKINFEEPFVNVIPIESFKSYNIMLGLPKVEKYYNSRDDCKCCLVF